MILRRDPLHDPAPLIRRVYAYVAFRIGPGAEAEDVTSETFERAVRYRGSYDLARGEPLAWLVGIARRRIAERSLGPHAGELPADGAAADDRQENAVIDRIVLADALGRVTAADRELLGLRYVADLSTREIGALLGMRANAVDVALHRARARLRAALTDGEDRSNAPSGTAAAA